jgi:hypothetical protein
MKLCLLLNSMILPILTAVINYLDTFPPLVILLVALNKKTLRGSYIFDFLAIQFICNLGANILNEFNWHNLFMYHLNCISSFVALSLFYIRLFNTRTSKMVIKVVGIIFTIFFFYDILKLEHIDVFNSNTFGLASFILCAYALFFYLKIFKSTPEDNILKSANFWFNTGIFSYYTINFFIFLTYNKLTHEKPPLLIIIWQLHNAIFLIMCVYLFIGTLCKRSQEKLKLS